MIRDGYYGRDSDHILFDIVKDRMLRSDLSSSENHPRMETTEIGMLYLKSFLNNLEEKGMGDKDYSLALAKAFLTSVAA